MSPKQIGSFDSDRITGEVLRDFLSPAVPAQDWACADELAGWAMRRAPLAPGAMLKELERMMTSGIDQWREQCAPKCCEPAGWAMTKPVAPVCEPPSPPACEPLPWATSTPPSSWCEAVPDVRGQEHAQALICALEPNAPSIFSPREDFRPTNGPSVGPVLDYADPNEVACEETDDTCDETCDDADACDTADTCDAADACADAADACDASADACDAGAAADAGTCGDAAGDAGCGAGDGGGAAGAGDGGGCGAGDGGGGCGGGDGGGGGGGGGDGGGGCE